MSGEFFNFSDMEIIKITPSDSKLWEQVWRLYIDSFPEWERRRISSHGRATEEDDFNTYIALDDGNLMGLIFYWKNNDFIYVEHLAITSSMRGKSFGSRIIEELIDEYPGYSILLEIDPPTDEISERRLAFYQRLGFMMNDYEYIHPSYSKNVMPHHLKIMSYPEPLSRERFESFKEYMANKVLKYID